MSEVLKELESLQQHRNELLQDAYGWSSAALSERPQPGGWCGLEVIEHLVRTDLWAAREIRLHATTKTSRRASRGLSQMLLLTIMRSPLRVKIPRASVELHPHLPESLHAVSEKWSFALRELNYSFEQAAEGQADQAVLHHPVGGWLDSFGAARFLVAHRRHHMRQWSRLKEHVS